MNKITCIFFLVFCTACPALADPPQKPLAAKKTTPSEQLPTKKTYQEWLQTYKAWDKLDEVYAQGDNSEENTLLQASAAMKAGNPRHVLEIVQSVSPFVDNNATEADRLWLGAQAYRALGDPEHAVYWHLQAAELMPEAEAKDRLNAEPGLDFVWKDVFRKLFQIYVRNNDLSREAQGVYLERLIKQAAATWSHDNFWISATDIYGATLQDVDSETQDATHQTYIYSSNINRLRIAKVCAFSSSNLSIALRPLIDKIDQAERVFWSNFLPLIADSDQSKTDCGIDGLPSTRARGVLSRKCTSLGGTLLQNWRSSPSSAEFELFRYNSRHMTPEKLHQLFLDNHEESLMDGDVPMEELLPLQLGLAIALDDREEAQRLWDLTDPATLSNGLKLAGMLYFELDFADVFRREPDLLRETDAEWLIALEAAGHVPPLPHLIPFWQEVNPEKDRTLLIRNWPLDLDVMLEVWKYDWSRNPQLNLARRVAYLYPEDQFGKLCTLYLAEHSLEDRQLSLSQYYLDGVDPLSTNSTLTAEYHRVDAELHILQEDMEGAYQAYQRLVATGAPMDDTTRLKIAFLLQQRGELEAGREHLLKLWVRKDEFKTSMQAEILFYLAEGEQAMGYSDQALDYYLHLAWQYPQESMWALTAMYRAATIYESRQQYEPAARLLKTVIKNAETAKQREAAKARLENIQARQAKDSGHGTGAVQYPF